VATAIETFDRQPHHRTRRSRAVATLIVALSVTLLARRQVIVGLALVAAVLVPLERAIPLVRRATWRPQLLTDLTHLLVTGILVAAATVVVVVVAVIPLLPLRALDLEAALPATASVALATMLVMLGTYWGHRTMHRVPALWRFHAVHHSIEHLDWLAAGRLHPLDSALTQACAIVPLVALGYDRGLFAGVTVVVTALAIFQHANVRLRVPVLRWVLPTPEWHHWHHARDAEAHDTNFGLPFVDALFGTAYLPRGRRATTFGIDDAVPADDYLGQLSYPFASAASDHASRGTSLHNRSSS
jgi:sterol desaturase/sphingolipid hydroxylase (fatty acid hydroxylase superfamily)